MTGCRPFAWRLRDRAAQPPKVVNQKAAISAVHKPFQKTTVSSAKIEDSIPGRFGERLGKRLEQGASTNRVVFTLARFAFPGFASDGHHRRDRAGMAASTNPSGVTATCK
jgi:hypothetical protein